MDGVGGGGGGIGCGDEFGLVSVIGEDWQVGINEKSLDANIHNPNTN